ncbi:GntR family transcriptional regulator [Nordella sp. HKS 07]|uniref:GntR family transcriptional regulator n=1 Tax=Nordella sp. HKS 07 TaxID=2712222 RepID=UPI0013E1698B|nr:GntR family transcriptional regulator [Nordella sp. HKS 07]QIG48453.1 GntR family transcriptional regulator [Nordella sp. HKS 07]
MNKSLEDRSQSLADRIRKTLIERIATGHYKSGERLIEMRLAEEFGTSQMPIREALRDLEMAGLVTAKPRRGSFVKPFASSAQREIYLVRGALGEAAARLATINPALDIDGLQAEVDFMRDAARNKNIEQMIRHSVAFHRAIVAAAGNELLLKLWDSLHLEIHTRVTLSEPGIDFMAAADSHQPIVDAIKAKDVELACRLSREHQAYFEHRLNV